MVVYIALFAAAVILGIPLTGKNPTKLKKIIYLSVMFLLMYLVTIFRYGIGNDYFSYIRIFEEIQHSSWNDLFTLGFEPLFSVVTKGLTYISVNPEFMYGVYAVFILAPVAYSIYRHSESAWLSVAVYLCLTFFYTSLNFIRQSMSVSLLILAYGFIKQKKIVPVIIFAVAAALFHYTALVFIPFYLLAVFVKPTKKSLIIYSSVSVGILVTCLIMKAAGANPLNLAADLVTAITGKDYSGYIGSMWFEDGFGVEYLIMPFTILALVMITYFLGWKEKEESHTLLWFMLANASIWSFITYAFIVERFSMFIMIFSVFAIPSVLNYYTEKARNAVEAEKAKQENAKKIPGYSKKKAEEKSDNAFLITIAATIGMFVYNCWGMNMNFHGVFPYMCGIPAVQDAIDGLDTDEELIEKIYSNADLYTYLIQLKNIDKSYTILSTTDDYDGLIPGIRRAADYAGTRLNRSGESETKLPFFVEYNNRNGEMFFEEAFDISYTTENGITIKNNGSIASVTDTVGDIVEIDSGKIMFVIFDENGEIFDTMQFDINQAQRRASKVQLKE